MSNTSPFINIGGVNIDLREQMKAIERYEAEQSLYNFLQMAWPHFDPAPFTGGWHIEAIAEHLEAVTDGEIKRLLINIPPRCCKSNLVSVAYPAWVWAQSHKNFTSGPGVKFLCASHSLQLAERDSGKCRDLLKTEWYQNLFGDRVTLRKDSDAKSRYGNEQGGERLIRSVTAGATGEGGDVIIIDDPNDASDANSEASRIAVTEWWSGTMTSRLNNKKNGAYIIIQQRVAENDLTGYLLDKNAEGWEHLMIPMRFEGDRKCVTSIGWEDPRTKEGDLLWPEVVGEPEAKAQEAEWGPFTTSGQYQQRPEPQGGGIIKREWWNLWEGDAYPEFDYVIGSCDTAYGERQTSDYSAMTVWGIYQHQVKWSPEMGIINGVVNIPTGTNVIVPHVMLMYAWAERLDFHELVEKIALTSRKFKVDTLLIENKASGISVAQEMRRVYSHEPFAVRLSNPGALDKVARLYSVQHLFADGIIHAPDKEWAEKVINQVSQFPRGKNDDLCFVGGTMIATARGNVPIEEIREGDMALTPMGFREIIACGPTGEAATVRTLGLEGTPEHPVFSLDRGWVPLDTVSTSTKVVRSTVCDSIQIIRQNVWSLMGSHSEEWAGKENTTSRHTDEPMTGEGLKASTLRFGKMRTAPKPLKGMKSITRMAIRLIVILTTLSAYRCACIAQCLRMLIEKRFWPTLKAFALSLLNGISQKRVGNGTGKIQPSISLPQGLRDWLCSPVRAEYAYGVGGILRTKTVEKSFVVPRVRTEHQDTKQEKPEKSRTYTSNTKMVYNMTVDGAHCYYANGILVHNCDTVSQAIRKLRDMGMLTRSPERANEIEESMHFRGRKADAPLYPV